MQLSLTLILLPFYLGMCVKAANHIVTVGPSGSTVYDPSSVTAAVGDTIEFQFASNNHSVAQAAFASPCQPTTGGIWSGFVITTGATSSSAIMAAPGYKRDTTTPSFTITVNDTNPAFFYCAQIGHCNLGMVFALNPSTNETLDAFKSAAAIAKIVVPSEQPQGGVLSTSASATTSSLTVTPTATSSGSFNVVSWGIVLSLVWFTGVLLS